MNNPVSEDHEVVLVLADDIAYKCLQRSIPVGGRMPAVMPLNWNYPIKNAAICSPEVQAALKQKTPAAGDVFIRQYNGTYAKIGTTQNKLDEFLESWQGGLIDQLNRVVDALLAAGATDVKYNIKSDTVEKTDNTKEGSINAASDFKIVSGAIDCEMGIRKCLETCRTYALEAKYRLSRSVKDVKKAKDILRNSGFFAERQLFTILEKIEQGVGATIDYKFSTEDCISSSENVNFALSVVASCPYCSAEIGTQVKTIINSFRTVKDCCSISITVPQSDDLNDEH